MNRQGEQRQLAATLYPLEGLEGIRYRFRILRVREQIPDDNYRPKRIQRWADRLWRNELRCPVYPTNRYGFPAFLIPEEKSPPAGRSLEMKDVPDKVYHIDVTEQLVEVAIEEAVGPERELVCRMLERSFTDRFQALRDKFWRDEWTSYFRMVPENKGMDRDLMNAYRGLKFRIVLLDGKEPHLAADVRTKYVGRKSLMEYTDKEKQTILKNHLDLDSPVSYRASFLRDNGPIKVPCRYTGNTGKTIDQCTFDATGETVYKYYRRLYSTTKVNPTEAAVFVQDRKKETMSRPVPISRLFPIFTTEYEGLRSCSVRPQMAPTERVSAITTFLGELSDIKFGSLPVSVAKAHLRRDRTVFIPPCLEFGKSEILDPFSGSSRPSKTDPRFDSFIVKWRSQKLPALYKAGPYHNEPLPDAVLLFPQTLDRPTRETFLAYLAKEIHLQTSQRLQIVQQRPYAIGPDERMGSSLLRIATEVRSGSPRCLAIIILWDNFMSSVHGELKETLKTVPSQCVTMRVVQNIVRPSDPQKATSQMRNLALGILTEVGIKPWVLSDKLHHDLHIGIDLLYGRIGYHFLYGPGGRDAMRQFGGASLRGRMQEAIKKPELQKRLEESIRSIVQSGHRICSIIIHRDGRWWPSEGDALREAVIRLKKDGILPPNVCWAVVEIRKNHMPVRLFTAVGEDSETFLQNPLPGTYLVLDKHRIILTTTGRPGAWDSPRGRTAGTLLLEIVESSGEGINIPHIAEDAYRLTHLNWNSPDIEIALPVTIRWTDEALRETFRSLTKEEEEGGKETSDEVNGTMGRLGGR